MHTIKDLKWYFKRINNNNNNSSITEVYESEHVLISQNGSLSIYKIQVYKLFSKLIFTIMERKYLKKNIIII